MYMNHLGQITPEEYPPKGELLPGAVQPIARRMVPLEASERRSEREQGRRFTPEPIPSENVILRDKQRETLETPREEEGTSSSETELQNPSLRKRSDAELDWELAEEGGTRSSVEAEQKRILDGLGGKGFRRIVEAAGAAAAAGAPIMGVDRLGGKGFRRIVEAAGAAAAAGAPIMGRIEMGMAEDMDPEDVQKALEQGLGISLSDEDDEEGRAEAGGKSRMKMREEDDDEKDLPPEDEVPPPPVAQAPSQGAPSQIPIQPGWRLMHNKVWGRVICREDAAEGRNQVEYVIVDPNGRKIEKVRFNSINCRIEIRSGYTVEEVGKAIVQAPKPAVEPEAEVEAPEPGDEEAPAAAPKGSHAAPRFRPQPEEKKVPLPPSLVDNIEFGESENMDPEKLESALEEGLGMDLADDDKDADDKGEQPPGVNGCGCRKEKPTPADAARLMELGLGDEVDTETREQIEDTFFGDE